MRGSDIKPFCGLLASSWYFPWTENQYWRHYNEQSLKSPKKLVKTTDLLWRADETRTIVAVYQLEADNGELLLQTCYDGYPSALI